jgi:uncharacterized protein YxjI
MKTYFDESLMSSRKLHVQQVLEGFEVALGFETRNKYRILDENMKPLAYAAEDNNGWFGHLGRVMLKHWRTFTINIYSHERELMYKAKFPFRWFFKTLILEERHGKTIGRLEQRFGIIYKKFDVFDPYGVLLAEIRSPIFKAWTFEFKDRGRKLGTVQKKWSGALTEIFTDKDNFVVSYAQPDLTFETKAMMLATCLMVDIVYFENNQGSGSMFQMMD